MDRAKPKYFETFMSGIAEEWFNTLDSVARGDYNAIERAFLIQYGTVADVQFLQALYDRSLAALRLSKESPAQSAAQSTSRAPESSLRPHAAESTNRSREDEAYEEYLAEQAEQARIQKLNDDFEELLKVPKTVEDLRDRKAWNDWLNKLYDLTEQVDDKYARQELSWELKQILLVELRPHFDDVDDLHPIDVICRCNELSDDTYDEIIEEYDAQRNRRRMTV